MTAVCAYVSVRFVCVFFSRSLFHSTHVQVRYMNMQYVPDSMLTRLAVHIVLFFVSSSWQFSVYCLLSDRLFCLRFGNMFLYWCLDVFVIDFGIVHTRYATLFFDSIICLQLRTKLYSAKVYAMHKHTHTRIHRHTPIVNHWTWRNATAAPWQ